MQAGKPVFFASPSEFRAWLDEHSDGLQEVWVGYYKKGSGKPSITWPESVDEALCCGWIDGLRKGIDEESYMIRFTPRKPRSIWSAVNIERVKELTAAGRMQPAGIAAYEKRAEDKSGIYAYEQKEAVQLNESDEAQLRANEKAWAFYQSQPAGYRKLVAYWIASAKKEETKRKRLEELIRDSAEGRTVKRFTRPAGSAGE